MNYIFKHYLVYCLCIACPFAWAEISTNVAKSEQEAQIKHKSGYAKR